MLKKRPTKICLRYAGTPSSMWNPFMLKCCQRLRCHYMSSLFLMDMGSKEKLLSASTHLLLVDFGGWKVTHPFKINSCIYFIKACLIISAGKLIHWKSPRTADPCCGCGVLVCPYVSAATSSGSSSFSFQEG
ncbi:hypothetical protein GOODEAATRI_015876 [Goodea atripinnis]|uniref:Uncharacterized protein n=1 Tax=Goodea atripinnis TaxID=208336 RepID=A0ABV0PNY1_9TELE